jgi:hypothetical protein
VSEPIVIDQSLLPRQRTQEWWSRYVPSWAVATVREDGTVAVTTSPSYDFPEGPRALTAAEERKLRAALERWVTGIGPLRAAVVSGVGGTQ